MKLTRQGVRDLNHIKPSGSSRKVELRVDPPDNDLLDGPMSHDLLYDPAALQDVLDRYPRAKVESTYDTIKGTRLSVTVPNCTLRNWLKFIISEGWGSTSLICQFMILDKPHSIEEVLNEIDPNWRDAHGHSQGRRSR